MERPTLRSAFSLARDLGMTAGEVLGRMTSLEMTHWQALQVLEQEEDRLAELGSTASAKLEGSLRARQQARRQHHARPRS